MIACPTAGHLYSHNHKIEVEPKQLAWLESKRYKTHTSIHAERLHQVSEALFLPARYNMQLFGRIFQPCPGANKGNRAWQIAMRVAAFVLWLITIPLALISALIAFPLRCIDHAFRPAISFLNNSASVIARKKTQADLVLTQDNPLHIRTHNLGLVSTSFSIVGDLRAPEVRARELVESIVMDLSKPDIIFFQEAFHEDATAILCEGIKQEYPYIIHNVLPQISGFNSGALIASKYPIADVKFQRLSHMIGPERMSPRGIIRVSLKSNHGPIFLYGVHTQALLGEERAKARYEQLEEIRQYMENDADVTPNALQVIMGDFNTSRVTAWGEDNLKPKGQAEEKTYKRLQDYFDDIYLRDHNEVTGQRTEGEAAYLPVDNERLSEPLLEPSGSWYLGPYAEPGFFLTAAKRLDRLFYDRPPPRPAKGIDVPKSTWGTRTWRKEQTACTARFDYILLPKSKGQAKLDGRAEIRRVFVPQEAQSAPSDHLPVDAKIWIKQEV